MTDLQIEPYNEVHVRINANRGILQELYDEFSFFVDGYQFMPKYKQRMWDGKIKLLNLQTRLIYKGLVYRILEWAKKNQYEVDMGEGIVDLQNFSKIEAAEFVQDSNIPYEIWEHQLKAFAHCVRMNRSVIVSPTRSGKSLIMYLIQRLYQEKTLLIVPRTSLVKQMTEDFIEYGCDENEIHQIMAGKEKNTDKRVIITTYQSLLKQPKSWFEEFGLVLGDECHMFEAKALSGIMEKCINTKYRFGFSGSLTETQVNEMVLNGHFGNIKQFVTTKELMEEGVVAELKIKCIVLKHSKEDKQHVNRNCKKYHEETEFVCQHEKRNRWIRNLALSLDKNTLILLDRVEKHGKILFEEIFKEAKDRKVFFVHGGVGVDDRERIRKITEAESNAIIIASYGVFSTGITFRNLHNLVFAFAGKSVVRNLQSIGRSLYLDEGKTHATLYEISDDFSSGERKNHSLNHLRERLKIYTKQQFNYKLYRINL